jgi:hypothetical protein
VYYHRVVMEVVRTLSRHLPRYESSVLAADSVADCEVHRRPSPPIAGGKKKLTSPVGRWVAAVAGGWWLLLCAQEAGKVETSLVELFKNFDIGVKKITAMKFESEKVRTCSSPLRPQSVSWACWHPPS